MPRGELVSALDTAALEPGLQAPTRREFVPAPSCSCMPIVRRPMSCAAEALARAAGFTQVSVSHRVSPLMKLVPRGDTTVVDAYLSPILRRYVEQIGRTDAGRAPAVHAKFRRLDRGRTLPGQGCHPVRTRGRHRRHGAQRARGRTRAPDRVRHGRHVDGRQPLRRASTSAHSKPQVAGVRVRAPMMSIHTIAAGGGSVIRFDGARLRVGPESAGADPGPCELPARRAARRSPTPT